MENLLIASVFTIITYTIYRLFELFVCRKERMAIIEKLSNGYDPQMLRKSNFLPQFRNMNNSGSWSIRIGLLLVGVGLGVVIAAVIDLISEPYRNSYSAIGVLYPACAALFGGMGLVLAYFIERRVNREKESED